MKIVNTAHLSLPTQRNVNGSLLAVLTNGGAESGDMAVYVGIVNLDVDSFDEYPDYDAARELAANWVAHSGVKLTFKKACEYFSGLSESDYRA